MNPSFVTHFGERNTTILDSNGTIVFTLLAVNGAGNGNAATFSYIVPERTLQAG